MNLQLPTGVNLVKTSGDEEGGAPYTRGTTIVFPGLESLGGDEFVRKVLAHELFHVLSRNDPEVRQQLYASIGFFPCGEISHPESLAVRRITNPDAPRNEYAIEVTVSGETRTVIPILYSRSATYDVERGGHFFEYLELQLLQIEPGAEGRAWAASEENGNPILFEVGDVVGFYEKIGCNTGYVIHPEEVLADNFALLVQGETEVTSPEILTKIKDVLIQAGAEEKA